MSGCKLNNLTIASVPAADIAAIREWARSQPYVVRVWLYGSRIKGTHDEGSDLDVAVEHEAEPGDDSAYASGISQRKKWQKEIQQATELCMDVQCYVPGKSEVVASGLSESGIIVYERRK